MLQARTPQVRDPQHACHYVAPTCCAEDPSARRIPLGYHPVTIARIWWYSNQQPPVGLHIFSDGNHKTMEVAGATYEAARAGITKGPLCVTTRVTGPQQPFRAGMQGTTIGSTLPQDGDQLFTNNKGVTTCAVVAPTRPCVKKTSAKQCTPIWAPGTNSIDIEWIPNHRQESKACNA